MMSVHQRKLKAAKHAKTMHSIKTLLGIITFTEQVTSKDRQQYTNLPMLQKLEAIANNVTGRVFGINAFNGVPKWSQTINPQGIANKWTGLGIGGIAYNIISKHSPIKLPHAGKVGSFAKVLLASGIFGGLFDDPPGYSHATFPGQVTPGASVTPRFISDSYIAGTVKG